MIKICITINSRACNPSYRLVKGFSLIELLVVMAIVGFIMAGVSLVNSSSSAKQINKQGDNLFAQMQYALDEALIRNTALGLLIEQDKDELKISKRYRWKRDNGVDKDSRERLWSDVKGYISSGELAEGLAWEVEIEDTSLEENLDRLLDDDDNEPQPRIIFYPSGEVSEFVITITLSEEALEDDPDAIEGRYKISLNERGELARYSVGVPDS
jgi:general secretion pathway protein H